MSDGTTPLTLAVSLPFVAAAPVDARHSI